MGKCRKCGCKDFSWNIVSAGQKLMSGFTGSYSKGGVTANYQTMPAQDNKSTQVAYNNCMCGHHKNYHSDD